MCTTPPRNSSGSVIVSLSSMSSEPVCSSTVGSGTGGSALSRRVATTCPRHRTATVSYASQPLTEYVAVERAQTAEFVVNHRRVAEVNHMPDDIGDYDDIAVGLLCHRCHKGSGLGVVGNVVEQSEQAPRRIHRVKAPHQHRHVEVIPQFGRYPLAFAVDIVRWQPVLEHPRHRLHRRGLHQQGAVGEYGGIGLCILSESVRRFSRAYRSKRERRQLPRLSGSMPDSWSMSDSSIKSV